MKSYEEARKFILSRIPDREFNFSPVERLQKAQELMESLDNPQRKLKIIHVAGTSGKGSAAFLASHILRSQGYKTGLLISPHIEDIRERIQINNCKISKEKFAEYVEEIEQKILDNDNTYFESLAGLAYHAFCQEGVDYAVIETGMGGTYDATNTALEKICVITRIGKDHEEHLGKELSEIAMNKAGIIQNGNKVITIPQPIEVQEVLEKQAKNKKSNVEYIKIPVSRKNVFDFGGITNIELGLRGAYQVENCCLAIHACKGLIRDSHALKSCLKKARFIGRFGIKGRNILDCAHNPQKMKAFVTSLQKNYPNKKFDFVMAFKKGKDWKSMLEIVKPVSKKIIITSFFTDNQDFKHLCEDPKKIAETTGNTCFETPEEALANSNGATVITGSIYLVSEIYPLLNK